MDITLIPNYMNSVTNEDGVIYVRYNGVNVVTIKNGIVTLNTDGKIDSVFLRYMNFAAIALELCFCVYKRGRIHVVALKDHSVVYEDGIQFKAY